MRFCEIRIRDVLLLLGTSGCFQASVSLKRLENFLNNGELDPDDVDRRAKDGSDDAIRVDNGTFKWGPDEDETLKKSVY